MYGRIRKIHFVGIGGIGTSGLAKVLIKQGAGVSGSDMTDGAVLQDLAGRGDLETFSDGFVGLVHAAKGD